MTGTAALTQRTRWSLGCALPVADSKQSGMAERGLPAGQVRPEYVSNQRASRGSSIV